MKVAILGGGAMGGLWADHLQRAGNDVVVVDVAQAVVDAISRDGLSVTSAEGSRTSRPSATTDVTSLEGVDVAYVFTKAHHTRTAAEAISAMAVPPATIVSLQNGWGNGDVITSVVSPERLVIGVTYQSARVDGPGAISHTSQGPTVLGPYVDGAPMAAAESIAAMQSEAGLPTSATDGVKAEIWKKVVLNTATLPSSALTGLYAGEVGQPGPLLDLVDDIARESVGVLRQAGYDIDPDERVEFINGLLGRAGRGKASMLQDVEARRKTEVEVVNGAIVREAARLGVEAPLNRAMVALIGGLERSWAQG